MAYIGPLEAADNPLYVKDKVALRISKDPVGLGDLVITERSFMWRPENRPDGISIPWTSISLHAISSEPVRSIYMQLDFRLQWPGVYESKPHPAENGYNGANNGMNEGGGDGEVAEEGADNEVDEGNVSDSSDDAVATEINIIPQDEQDINQIYYAMNHCQTVNPDPNESISADEDDDDFMDAEQNESDDDAGHGEMQNLHLNDDDDERFADD